MTDTPEGLTDEERRIRTEVNRGNTRPVDVDTLLSLLDAERTKSRELEAIVRLAYAVRDAETQGVEGGKFWDEVNPEAYRQLLVALDSSLHAHRSGVPVVEIDRDLFAGVTRARDTWMSEAAKWQLRARELEASAAAMRGIIERCTPFVAKAYREGGVPTFSNAGDLLDEIHASSSAGQSFLDELRAARGVVGAARKLVNAVKWDMRNIPQVQTHLHADTRGWLDSTEIALARYEKAVKR